MSSDPREPVEVVERIEKALHFVGALLWALAAAGLAGAVVLGGLKDNTLIANAVPDTVFRALAAYFLPRRRSRGLAVALAVVSLGDAVVTGADGHLPWADLLGLLVAARAVQMTFAWHKAEKTELRPGNVIGVLGVTAILAAAAAVAAETALRDQLAPSFVDAAAACASMLIGVFGFTGLLPGTGHRPFAVGWEPPPPLVSTSAWGPAPEEPKTRTSLVGALVLVLVAAIATLYISQPWHHADESEAQAAAIKARRPAHAPACWTGADGEHYGWLDPSGALIVTDRLADVPLAEREGARCMPP